jgi:lipopolysaccharide export system protein LptC
MTAASQTAATAAGASRARSFPRAMAAARRRTRFVALLRIALAAALVAVGGQALVRILADTRENAGDALAPAGDSERIVNARFTGRDQDGQPYVITSDAAERRGGTIGGQAALDNPRLDYALLLGEAMGSSEALASAGAYDEATRTLHLDRSVRLNTRDGYMIRTERASVDLVNARIFGDDPVQARAPWGQVRANGFSLENRGRIVRFTGGVSMRLETGRLDAPEGADE